LGQRAGNPTAALMSQKNLYDSPSIAKRQARRPQGNRFRLTGSFNPGQKQLFAPGSMRPGDLRMPASRVISKRAPSMAVSGRSREIIRSALSMASSPRAGPFSNSSAMNTYRKATFR
jgi:hypothetical protein